MSAIALLSVGCAASPEDRIGEQTFPITNGEPDLGDASVVAILTHDAEPHLACTGSLIQSRLVLTAAHCLVYLEETPLSVAFGASAAAPDLAVDVIEWSIHPAYRLAPLAPHDIAVLLLKESAPIEPLPLGAIDADDSDTAVRLVGFGATELGEVGQKRTGAALVDRVDETRFKVVPSPALTCYLDSGAPALLGRDGREELVGVTTSGDDQCAVFTRLTRLQPYLDDFVLPMLQKAELGGPLSELPGPRTVGCQFATGNGPAAPNAAGLAAFVSLCVVAWARKLRGERRVAECVGVRFADACT